MWIKVNVFMYLIVFYISYIYTYIGMRFNRKTLFDKSNKNFNCWVFILKHISIYREYFFLFLHNYVAMCTARTCIFVIWIPIWTDSGWGTRSVFCDKKYKRFFLNPGFDKFGKNITLTKPKPSKTVFLRSAS